MFGNFNEHDDGSMLLRDADISEILIDHINLDTVSVIYDLTFLAHLYQGGAAVTPSNFYTFVNGGFSLKIYCSFKYCNYQVQWPFEGHSYVCIHIGNHQFRYEPQTKELRVGICRTCIEQEVWEL